MTATDNGSAFDRQSSSGQSRRATPIVDPAATLAATAIGRDGIIRTTTSSDSQSVCFH
jgi:hypothetical protein